MTSSLHCVGDSLWRSCFKNNSRLIHSNYSTTKPYSLVERLMVRGDLNSVYTMSIQQYLRFSALKSSLHSVLPIRAYKRTLIKTQPEVIYWGLRCQIFQYLTWKYLQNNSIHAFISYRSFLIITLSGRSEIRHAYLLS